MTWMKDGEIIYNGGTYEVVQILQDGEMAVYNNLLKVYLEPSNVIGNYTCMVENLVSEPDERALPIQGHSLILVVWHNK